MREHFNIRDQYNFIRENKKRDWQTSSFTATLS